MSKKLNVALWVAQVLLAALFLFAGCIKLFKAEEVAPKLGLAVTWVYLLGAAEVAGGLGLVLPSLLRIQPVLTPVAALCLTVIMAGAIPFDLKAGNPPMTILFGAILLFIAWGRLTRARISPRGSPATARG